MLNSTLENFTNSSLKQCDFKEDPYGDLKLFNFSLTVFISVFGLIGNTIVISVNCRVKKPTSTDVYLTFLAVTDNFMIVATNLFAYRYVYLLLSPGIENWSFSGYITFPSYLLRYYFQCLNTLVIVLVNVDRYILIKRPQLAKSWCTPRRAVCHFFVAIVCSALYTLPRLWELIPLMLNSHISIARCQVYYSFTHGISRSKTYRKIYVYAINSIVMYAIPLIIMSVTNFTLISTILERRRWLSGLRKGRVDEYDIRKGKKDLNAVRTLCAVTITFMVLQIPDIIVQIVWKVAFKHGPTAAIFVSQLMIVNFSVNFIIYSVTSSVFRKRLRKLFSSCCSCGSYTQASISSSANTNSHSAQKDEMDSHPSDNNPQYIETES